MNIASLSEKVRNAHYQVPYDVVIRLFVFSNTAPPRLGDPGSATATSTQTRCHKGDYACMRAVRRTSHLIISGLHCSVRL